MSFFADKRAQELGPFSVLLGALVLYMGLSPFVSSDGLGDALLKYGFIAILIAGLGVARKSRSFLGIALVLVAANLAARWLSHLLFDEAGDREVLSALLGAAYVWYLILVLVRTLTRQTETTLDVVLGGINVYLLLALGFMMLHLALEQYEPGSYLRGGLALSAPENLSHGKLSTSLIYFSFTTLTTLGFGDITPARPVAEMLTSAEAVIGQLYVAIFIGGLVALRISERSK